MGFFTDANALPGGLFERLSIADNGFVGIGTTVPAYILDVNGRIRLKHNVNTSGLWLANAANNDDVAFVGLHSDNHIGFYGDAGGGWNFLMNTTTGNVGIGTTSPAYPLDVRGSSFIAGKFENTNTSGEATGLLGRSITATEGFGIFGEGKKVGATGKAIITGTGSRWGVVGDAANGDTYNFGVQGWATGGSAALAVWGSASGGVQNWAGYFEGNVYSTGTYQGSDRKLKSGIAPISDAMSILNKLKPTMYTYKTREYAQMQLPEGMQYGLIADEVKQILPGIVKIATSIAQYENHDEVKGRKISDAVDFEAINYTAMIPILIGALQEQQKQIDELKEEVGKQRMEIDELMKK